MEEKEGKKGHSLGQRQQKGKKNVKEGAGGRWEAREARTQEQGEAEGCEREYALGDRREISLRRIIKVEVFLHLGLKGKRGKKGMKDL